MKAPPRHFQPGALSLEPCEQLEARPGRVRARASASRDNNKETEDIQPAYTRYPCVLTTPTLQRPHPPSLALWPCVGVMKL